MTSRRNFLKRSTLVLAALAINWYAFSALGFYPVCPGSDQYVVGSPLFNKVTVTLENGKRFEINAPNNHPTRRYITDLKLNGANYTKNYFTHKDLMNGAKITIEMSETPNKERGIEPSDFPYSFTSDEKSVD